MKAVLLAAGFGTRLRPLTDRLPKCMVPIGGRPLLGIWIDMLLEDGCEKILINTHYLPEVVRDFVQNHSNRGQLELFHEPKLLGTAGTLLALASAIGNESFLCAHADNLARIDLPQFRKRHRQRAKEVEITMLAFDTDNPSACGVVEENALGVVTAFHEKSAHPPSRRANGAVYIMEPSVIGFIRGISGDSADLSTQVLPHYCGRMQTWYDPDTYLRDIGTPESLRLARQEWSECESRQLRMAL
ncbi:MAG: nucleotidyltransferase family protein [Burkholderiales bacterium]